MGRACSPAAVATSGGHPDRHPDFPRRGAGLWSARGQHEPAGGSIRGARRGARGARSRARRARFGSRRGDRARRGAGDRQDAPAGGARGAGGRARSPGARRLGLGARARPAVLGVRGCARRVPAGARPAAARRARERCAGGARARLPVAVRARQRGTTWRSSTSAIAAIARCARCSSSSRRAGRSCSCSTTSTGPTRRPSSCSARCCAGRRPRRC